MLSNVTRLGLSDMWFMKKKRVVRKKRVKKQKKGFFAKFRDMKLFSKVKKKSQVNHKRRKKISLKTKILIWVLWLTLFFVVLGGLYIGYCYVTLPDFTKALYVERNRGIKILANDGREITSYGNRFDKPVKIDELPNYVHQSIVDTEDRRFYKHKGIDYIGFIRAMGVNLFKMRYAQGASTLTQQVAKNLFLTSEKSIKRKIQEFIIAKKLEENFSKKQILEIYINRVFFGNGAYGINAASRRFFNKKAQELNMLEAAILAGSLKAPSKYNYIKNRELAIERANVVLSLMKRAGTINKEQLEAAKNMPINNPDEGMILGGRYFGDFVLSELENSGIDDGQDDIYILTTLDYDLQQRAEYLLRKNLRENVKNNVNQGAVVIIDRNGKIKAMAGGFDYKQSQFNRATQAVRQAGSSFKLFVYMAALEKGMKITELLSDEPIKIGNWEPKNYDKKFHGAVSMKEAFANSLNVATIDLATYVGLPKIIDVAHRMGISTTLSTNPSIILGADAVKLIDMARAYSVVANGGYDIEPYVIEEVKTSDDEVIYAHENKDYEKLFSDDVIKSAKILLREVVLSGTGKIANKVKNAHAKTGTTQNYRDAWFIGFDDKYTTAVWIGNDDNSSMNNITGGSLAGRIWTDIMQ